MCPVTLTVPERGLIRRDREIRIFGYFSFFMYARIISERDFQTIHLKIITHQKGLLVSGDLGPVSTMVPSSRSRDPYYSCS